MRRLLIAIKKTKKVIYSYLLWSLGYLYIVEEDHIEKNQKVWKIYTTFPRRHFWVPAKSKYMYACMYPSVFINYEIDENACKYSFISVVCNPEINLDHVEAMSQKNKTNKNKKNG